jgi:hypothetical protein
MYIIDCPHHRGIAVPTTYTESYQIPCEGARARVVGQILVINKDYTNIPTISAFDLRFANTLYHIIAGPTLGFAATAGGLGVVVAPSFRDTDVGIEIDDFITEPSGLLTLSITFSAVPAAFNCYVRPRLRVMGVQPISGNLDSQKTRIDKPYSAGDMNEIDPVIQDLPGRDKIGTMIGLENLNFKVIKQDLPQQ